MSQLDYHLNPMSIKDQTSEMSTVRLRIRRNFDLLEEILKSQKHMEDSFEEVTIQEIINNCSRYWRFLDEEHKDFLNAARYAIEEKIEWK